MHKIRVRHPWALALAVVAALALSLSAFSGAFAEEGKAVGKTMYFCGCGPDCKCKTVSDQPGKCACDKALIKKKVLKEDAKNLYICACPESCECDVSKDDAAKCGCGKDLIPFPKKT